MPNQTIKPDWYEGPVPERSFRSIFRWGAPDQYKHPNAGLVSLVKELLEVPAEQLVKPSSLGLDPVSGDPPIRLTLEQVEKLIAIVGEENAQSDVYPRLRASYGQNPWNDRDQAITSISWVSRIKDARESLMRSRWDLIVVDRRTR